MDSCTCVHLKPDVVNKAADSVCGISQRHNYSKNDMACIDCGLQGSSSDLWYRQHFLEKKHMFLVRIQPPFEIFCCYCGDYQYSNAFDELVGKKRKVLVARNGKKDTSKRQRALLNLDPRGLCNMGSTCFMGSVLQILLHNPALVFSRQLQLGNNSLFTCTKSSNDVQSNFDSSSAGGDADSSSVGNDVAVLTCIACELRKLFCDAAEEDTSEAITSSKNSSLVPSNLLYSVWNYADYMAGYDQQDAHEFLIALLDGLGTHLEKYHGDANVSASITRSASSSSGSKSTIQLLHAASNVLSSSKQHSSPTVGQVGENRAGSITSPSLSPQASLPQSPHTPRLQTMKGLVNEVFTGLMRSDLYCTHCGHRSCKHEPFLDISLSLDVANENGGLARACADGSISLLDCLHHFTSMETLSEQIECEVCEEHRPFKKQLSLALAPRVLILHFKRFDALRQLKISNEVTFPLRNLDLTPFMRRRGKGHHHSTSKLVKQEYFSSSSAPVAAAATATATNHQYSLYDGVGSSNNVSVKDDKVASGYPYDNESASPNPSNLPFEAQPQPGVVPVPPVLLSGPTSPTDGTTGGNSSFRLRSVDSAEISPSSLPLNAAAADNTSSGSSGRYLYDLQGLVCHKGSLTQGHYISYVATQLNTNSYNNDGSQTHWLRCDDEHITPVSNEEVLRAEGYLLFYVCREHANS